MQAFIILVIKLLMSLNVLRLTLFLTTDQTFAIGLSSERSREEDKHTSITSFSLINLLGGLMLMPNLDLSIKTRFSRKFISVLLISWAHAFRFVSFNSLFLRYRMAGYTFERKITLILFFCQVINWKNVNGKKKSRPIDTIFPVFTVKLFWYQL